MYCAEMVFSGEKQAVVLLWAKHDDSQFRIKSTKKLSARLCNAYDDRIGIYMTDDIKGRLRSAGIYRLYIARSEGGESKLCFEDCDDVVPFVIPGPGIVFGHGLVWPLRFLFTSECTLYSVIADFDEIITVSYQGGSERGMVQISFGENDPVNPEWLPSVKAIWYSARIPTEERIVKLKVPKQEKSIRLTLWDGQPVFLKKPDAFDRLGRVKLSAYDENGANIDARFNIYLDSELIAQRDMLIGEQCIVELPEGSYSITCSHGNIWSEETQKVQIRASEECNKRFMLRELVDTPKGWVWGELHCHTVFEDASAFPDRVMRAARANGMNFCFATDRDINAQRAYGVGQADLPGRYIGLSGQEIMAQELHMNVLNAPDELDNPEVADLHRINPDIRQRMDGWMESIRRMQQAQPCIVMLNHPHHNEPLYSYAAYFRSWWVLDVYPGIPLVENFDYRTWFDRLNRGDHLTGIWTTDSHDCTNIYPGKKATCVYVGDQLTPENILRGLEGGRCFGARKPGTFLDLSVNGVGMGGTIVYDKQELLADIRVRSAVRIEVVELVVNGRVEASWNVENATAFDCRTKLRDDALWAIIRVKLSDSNWQPEDRNSLEPLMTSGYAAFSNPVYIRRNDTL